MDTEIVTRRDTKNVGMDAPATAVTIVYIYSAPLEPWGCDAEK